VRSASWSRSISQTSNGRCEDIKIREGISRVMRI